DSDVLDSGGDDLRLRQPLRSQVRPLAVDLDTDQLGVGIALEGCEQIALAAGAVDDAKVTAGEFEQIARDLLSPFVGRGLMPGVSDVGECSVGHGKYSLKDEEYRNHEDTKAP